MRQSVLAACCTFFLSLIGGVSSPVQASAVLTGFEIGTSPPISANASGPVIPLQPDPFTVAAADLPVHDPKVGTLAGQAGVDGGAATYQVPLVVPPGRAGMQPALALVYNSRSGDGIAGMGWSLSGGSSVHRCPQTPEQDGKTVGVSYTSTDRLCLDGQRLVAVEGSTYGNAGAQYRTEIDSFARIYQVGGDLTSSGACFRVEEKSGRVLHYGAVVTGANTPTGCASSSAFARVNPSGVTATLSWLLEKVEDRVGNNMLYDYAVHGSGENLLNRVRYTGLGSAAGDRSVELAYQDRLEPGSSYLAGGLSEQKKRLLSITTKVDGSVVRTLTPAYVTGTYSGRPLLKKLTECATDPQNGSQVCHAPTQFRWNDGVYSVELAPLTAANLPGADANTPVGGGVSGSRQLRVIGDLDGDGARESLVGIPRGSEADVYLVQLAADRSVRSAINFTGVLPLAPERYADLDGDGRAEVIRLPPTPVADAHIALGIWKLDRGTPVTASAFQFIPSTVPWTFNQPGSVHTADVDGDGRLDLVTATTTTAHCGSDSQVLRSGVFVHTNTMTAPLTAASASANFSSSSTPLFCLTRTLNPAGQIVVDEQLERIADFNGDGLPDFFIRNDGTGLNRTFSRVVLGRPVGTAPVGISCNNLAASPGLSVDECDRARGYFAQWLDINGDGLDDYVFAKPGGTWQLRLNKGGRLGPLITTTSSAGLDSYNLTTPTGVQPTFRYVNRLPAMDVDSDGKTDLLAVSSTSGRRGFALKMCVASTVSRFSNGDCPDAREPGTSPNGETVPVEAANQCVVYACPQDPGSTTLDMPPNATTNQGYPAIWYEPGGTVVPVFPMYNNGGTGNYGNYAAFDQSAYHVDQLRFAQTGENAFTVQVLPTPMITQLQLPATDDVFGDGLPDLITDLGCQYKQVSLAANGPNLPGCLVIGDDDYGPAMLPNGRLASTFNAVFSGVSYTSVLEAHVNENRGAANGGVGNQSEELHPPPAPPAPRARATNAFPPRLPDLLLRVTDGMGDTAAWTIVPLAFPAEQGTLPLYQLPAGHGYADKRHYYFTSTMPVVSGFNQHTGLVDASNVPQEFGWRSAIYGYTEAMYNHMGRGFQGFRSIASETATLDPQQHPRVRTTTTFHQKFPLTGRVESVVSTVPGTATKISEEKNTWRCKRAGRGACDLGDALVSPTATSPLAPFLDEQIVKTYEPTTGALSHQVTTINAASAAAANSGWDPVNPAKPYGNLVDQVVIQADDIGTGPAFLQQHTTTTVNTFAMSPALADAWWIDQQTRSAVTRKIAYASGHALPAGAVAPDLTLVTDTAWNPDRTLQSRTVQPGQSGQESETRYFYAGTTSGLPSKIEVFLPGVAAALAPLRTVSYTYSKDGSTAADDGYFVLTTTRGVASAGLSHTSTTLTAPRDGQVLSAADPNGIRTVTTYDAFGRATEIRYLASNGSAYAAPTQIALTRCVAGVCAGGVSAAEDATPREAVLRQTTVRAGYPTTVVWSDVLGRTVKQASGGFGGNFSLSVTSYDVLGRVDGQSIPFFPGIAAIFTTMDYDRIGRLTRKMSPASSLDPVSGDVVSEYKYSGRSTTVTVRGSNVALSGGNCPSQPPLPTTAKLCLRVVRTNDARGALMQTTDAANRKVNYWTDAQGQVAAIKDDDGVISATYNALGQRLSSSDPDQGSWQFTSNALGELVSQTDARGATTSVTARDILGRVTEQTTLPRTPLPAGMDAAAFHDSWVYDPANAKGAVASTRRRRGSNSSNPSANPVVWGETHSYDNAARPTGTSTSTNEGSPVTLASTQSYDATTGRPRDRTYPGGLTVRTSYTPYGQPAALGKADGTVTYWTATAHDVWGQVSGESFANGISGTQVTDAQTGQPRQRKWMRGNQPLQQIDYSYDSFSNLKGQSREGNTETYAYDVLQRLVRSSRTTGGNVDYRYAANGNLTLKTDYSTATANSYTYGGNGCGPHAATGVNLAGGGIDTYNCDANGNVIGGSTLALRFAADNRAVHSGRGNVTATDPSCVQATQPGDRIFCTGFQASGATPAGSTAWAYASDGFRYYTASSRGLTYFDRHGYERTGTVERHELGPVIVTRIGASETVATVLADRLGSTIATADAASITTRAYDAFGQVRNGNLSDKPNGTLTLPGTIHGFTQHEHADDVRLIHMKGRLYDYRLGRFLSVDPILQFPANSQSLNPYSYIMNNPLAGTDPTGFAVSARNGGCTAMTGSRICGVNTGAVGGVTSKTTVVRDGKGGYVRVTESKGARGERSFTGVWKPGNGARGQSTNSRNEKTAVIEDTKTPGQQGLQQASEFGKSFADTGGKVLEIAAPVDPDYPIATIILPFIGKIFGASARVAGVSFRKIEKEVLEQIGVERKIASGLLRGSEIPLTFSNFNSARKAARELSQLGDDAVDFVQEIGDHKGRVTGRMSPDESRGWRIDYDSAKGFHVNWWIHEGRKREQWLYGANKIDGGTEDDFLRVLEHFPGK